MSGLNFTSQSVPVTDKALNGGLNSTSGPLNVANNESSELQNVDFNKFGSVVKRNGYSELATSGLAGTPVSDGLHWFEYQKSGTLTRELVAVNGGKLVKMDALDGTFDDITGTVAIAATKFCDFDNFLNEVYITNNNDVPCKYNGTASSDISDDLATIGLTKAKFVKQFNNYLFLANVTVGGTVHQSRFYWSGLKDTDSWTATHFIDVAKDDGQDITGIKVLGDRLVIFKRRSIYTVRFTGDPDIPFILPDGGKTNSAVGCVAPFSIQEVENGLVFFAQDGFYFFDGNNSFKISDKITTTIEGFNDTKFENIRSMVQKGKNRYWTSFTSSGETENDIVMCLDWFNNAWTLYSGMAPASMTTVYASGIDERPYFGDYDGYYYRADTGDNDNPLGVETAVDAYYYTNWKHYDDLIDKKNVPHVRIFYQSSNSVLTFAYSYDFESGDQYSTTFSTSVGTALYGSAVYGTDVYASSGGQSRRRDLIGSGHTVRFKFQNSTVDETFQIDGFGSFANLESNK